MRRMGLLRSSILLLVVVAAALGASFAFASGVTGPAPNTEYTTNVTARPDTYSIQISVQASGTKVSTMLLCYQKHGVQVQADTGSYFYRLHHGAFSVDKKYEVDKLIPQDGDTVEEAGHGKVLLTGRFTNGEFVGKVQIEYKSLFRSEHLGGGCRKVSYVAHVEAP